MKILVTGGTGALGRDVVKKLQAAGHTARVLSRKPSTEPDWAQGDIATGAGLGEALIGIDAVVHAATAAAQPWKLRATDVVGTRRVLAMSRAAGVRHVVYVSIVGMEGVAYPYYKRKVEAEAVVRENIVPWTILRATQFHSLMETFLSAFSTVPGVAMVPKGWQFQPVDTADVAERMVEVVTGEPAGLLPDFGGPEMRNLGSLAVPWLAARHPHKRLVNLNLPFKFSRQFTEGHLLAPHHRDGTTTFEQYLETRYPREA
ncbi:MAG: NAD(P)H-binding protein [Candidatus Dormiibacterota bacterium]